MICSPVLPAAKIVPDRADVTLAGCGGRGPTARPPELNLQEILERDSGQQEDEEAEVVPDDQWHFGKQKVILLLMGPMLVLGHFVFNIVGKKPPRNGQFHVEINSSDRAGVRFTASYTRYYRDSRV